MGLVRKPGQLLGVLALKLLYTPARAARAEAWGEAWGRGGVWGGGVCGNLLGADFHNWLGFCELMYVKLLHECWMLKLFDRADSRCKDVFVYGCCCLFVRRL